MIKVSTTLTENEAVTLRPLLLFASYTMRVNTGVETKIAQTAGPGKNLRLAIDFHVFV